MEFIKEPYAIEDGAHLRAIMDMVLDGLIAIDDRGTIQSFSRSATRMFGYEPEEVIGKNVNMLMPEPYHSGHDGYVRNYLATGIAKIIGIGREVLAKRKDGSIFPMELGINEMRIGDKRMFMGSIRDISERKASAAALRESEQRYELAVQGLSVGIWDWDIATNALYWSPRFREIISCLDEKLENRYDMWESRLHPEDRERTVEELYNHLRHEGPYDVEYRLRRDDGTYAWIHARGQAVWDAEGEPLHMVGSIDDITRRKEAEQKLQKALEDLKRSNEELESFTYIASHDLRSPLVNLRGFAGELHRSVDTVIPMLERILPMVSEVEREILLKEITQRIPKALAYINASGEKMDRMTGAILKLSRLGHREIVFENLNTKQLVMDCLAPLEHQIQQHRTIVEMKELPDIVGDKTAIEQVFGNLLDNAIKYLDPARAGHIVISGQRHRMYTLFSVQDNGRGIAKDDLHKVFEIFRRAGDVEHIPGEGMGMPYVRSIIKRHGGDIWCESTQDAGTAFHFTIAHKQADRKVA